MADLLAGNYTAAMGGETFQSGTFMFTVNCDSSISATNSPTESPLELSTTPSPTEVDDIVTCGDEVVGDYNNEPISIYINVPEPGDITLNATGNESNLDNVTLRVSNYNGVFAVDGATTDDDGIQVKCHFLVFHHFTCKSPKSLT